MSEAKFTPGPWRTAPDLGNESVLAPDGLMVADCAIFAPRHKHITSARNRANAHLIAASPDLYAACLRAKDHLINDLNEPGRTVFWALVAALKKAGWAP